MQDIFFSLHFFDIFSQLCYTFVVKKGGFFIVILGKYDSKLDSKNRLFVPSAFASEFQSEILFLTSLKEFILVSTPENFEVLVESFLSKKMKELRENFGRGIYSSTFSCKMDAQRRILLPSSLVKENNVTPVVTWIGMKNYAEIWNSDEYNKWKNIEFPDGLSVDDFKLDDGFSKSFKSLR